MIRTLRVSVPACVNCVHFIPHKNPCDAIPDSFYGKCRKFFDVDLVTGNVSHEYARVCRISKCGVDGKEFVKKY